METNHRRLRTSQTDPLRVDCFPWPGTAGRVGLTLCPGKHDPDALTARWSRDLEIDVDALRHWGAAAVLSVVTGEELLALRVPALGAALAARGIEWHHAPITDGCAPGRTFEQVWPWVRLRLLHHLTEGRGVVVHCKGGLGRAGTVASRMLVELAGLSPVQAVQTVRAARPGAVETEAQHAHLAACRPVPESALLRQSRVLGCLLGGALGDAFGYGVEFDSLEAIRARHGADGLREPVLRAGRLLVSDDTQMTLFTLEGLIRAREAGDVDPRPFLREAYLDWWLTQQPGPPARWPYAPRGTLALMPALQACRAPGLTCLKALADGGRGTLGRPDNDSKGCGAVMRSAPFGFDGLGATGGAPALSGAALAAEAGAITHGHPESSAACAVMAALVQSLFAAGHAADTASEAGLLHGALVSGRREAAAWQAAAPLTARLMDQAVALAAQGAAGAAEEARSVALLGEGWVAEEALAIGLLAALAGDDFTHVLRIAANHDGDSDSTASVAGQLRGAARGVAGLPHHWVMKLDVLDPLFSLAARA